MMGHYTLLLWYEREDEIDTDFFHSLKKNMPSVKEFISFCHSEQKSPSVALLDAVKSAQKNNGTLVILRAPLKVSEPILNNLTKLLEEDHLYGIASPRFMNASKCLSVTLPRHKHEIKFSLSRRAMAALPKVWITPELLSGCILLKKQIIDNPPQILEYSHISTAILDLMRQVRKRGFKTVTDNRSFLKIKEEDERIVYPILNEKDSGTYFNPIESFAAKATSGKPVTVISKEETFFYQKEAHKIHELEDLLIAAYPPEGKKRHYLIDCRGMIPHFCGTSKAQIGYLSGFANFTDQIDITVWIQQASLDKFELKKLFPNMNFVTDVKDVYAAILFLSQPCFDGLIKDFHQKGFVNGCNMLDTITLDKNPGVSPEIERVWNFCADHMDCLFYISDFSKTQFNHRFSVRKEVNEVVTYLSMDKEENLPEVVTTRPEGIPEDFILVFGNNYEHKDILPTSERLAEMFPTENIVAFGPDQESRDNILFLQSGGHSDEFIESLFQYAKVVVFPSWIEGFGLPVIKTLALGKPLILRDMPLWHELVSVLKLPGTMHIFKDQDSLKDCGSAALRGIDSKYTLQQNEEIEILYNWDKCAEMIVTGTEAFLQRADSKKWFERNKVISFL